MKVRLADLNGMASPLAAGKAVMGMVLGSQMLAPVWAETGAQGGTLGTPAQTWLTLGLGAGFAAATLAAGCLALRLKSARAAARSRERDAAEANWRLNLALEAAGLGYWEYDPVLGTLDFDSRKREMTGFDTAQQASVASWLARVAPEHHAAVQAGVTRALESSETVRFACDVMVPGRGLRRLEDTACAMVGHDGRRRVVGLACDVTERHAAAAELRARQRRAEELAEEKGGFLAMLSHEIRTPMAGIIGMLDLLIDDPEAAEREERLALARRSAETLLTIVNDVLSFSRLEAGKFDPRPEPTRPGQIIREVIDLLTPKARAKALPLRWSIAPDVPEWVTLDPGLTRQIVVNLASNALKFTDSGEVAIRADMVPGTMILRIEVRDTGIGMAPAFLERAFDSFSREEAEGEPREGTGLGLAISKELARLMGGAITLRSVPGEGTVARFSTPIAPATAPDRSGDGSADPFASSVAPMRILVAEDNSTNSHLVRALLERDGHHVTTVSDGAAAARLATEDEFDVVLMDVQMPVMDGTAATRAIRASGSPRASVPIIALTANVLANDWQSYLACGMSDCVSKPIVLADLHGALNRVAARRRQPVS